MEPCVIVGGDTSQDPRLTARIKAEQLRQIAAGATLAAIMGPIWTTLIALLLHSNFFPELGTISLATATAHIGMITLWSLVTAGFVWRMRSAQALEMQSEAWARIARLYLPTGAVTWSACLLMLWQPGNPLNHLFVGTLFYATALAFIGCYASQWRIYVSLQVVILGSLTVRAIAEGLQVDLVIVILALAFLITALYSGWLVHRHIRDALLLRFRNEGLAFELGAARDEALAQRKEAVASSRAKSAFLANMKS